MRLSRLSLANFRSCEDVQVDFAEDLTVVVGENASGKGAVIDAVRLATTPAIEGSGIAFSPEFDPTQGADETAEVKISATYDELTTAEQAIYLAELVDVDDRLRYNVVLPRSIDLPSGDLLGSPWGSNSSMIRSQSIANALRTCTYRPCVTRSVNLIRGKR